MGVAMTDRVQAEIFDPFRQGNSAYIGSMDIEVGFASKTKIQEAPYDQDVLAREVLKVNVFGHLNATVDQSSTRSLTARCSHQVKGF
jgi:hypothetical protein